MPISQIILATTSGGGGGGGGGGGYTGSGPAPGGGDYLNSWPNSAGWSSQGTPFVVDGGVASIDNLSAGWNRKIYTGQWSISGINGNDVPGIFDGVPNFTVADAYGGFGTDNTGDYYCIEWKGYIQVSNTGNYNFVLDSDDVAMFWIGSAAVTPNFDNKLLWTNNGSQLNANSPNLYSGLYYPIRMRFQEWSGAERCQLFMGQVGSGLPLQAMGTWALSHNGITQGY